jgi:hypothetical protein
MCSRDVSHPQAARAEAKIRMLPGAGGHALRHQAITRRQTGRTIMTGQIDLRAWSSCTLDGFACPMSAPKTQMSEALIRNEGRRF